MSIERLDGRLIKWVGEGLIEVDVLMRLRSPFLLRGEEVILDPFKGIGVFIEEAVGDLSEITLPKDQRRKVLGQITRGLWDLHQAGIFHLDLKPDNFLLMKDGRVVLSDFGMSAYQRRGRGQWLAYVEDLFPPEITRVGSTGGYLTRLEPASEVYVLALTLFEVYSDSYLSSVEEAKVKIRKWDDQELSGLFLKMLDSSPGKRPTLEEVKDFFQVEGEPLEILAPSPVEVRSLSGRRRIRETAERIPHEDSKVRSWIACSLLDEPLPRVDKAVKDSVFEFVVRTGGKLIGH